MASASDACSSSTRFRFLCVLSVLLTLLFITISSKWLEGGATLQRIYDKHIKTRNPLLPRLKYDHTEPLRQMFFNASKSMTQESQLKFTASRLHLSDLQELQSKDKVLMLVIVSTAPSRQERRQAIRDSWWKACDGLEVVCKFFTDGLQLSEQEEIAVSKEQKRKKDLVFQPLESTRNFGLRYLYHIMWATAKYDFTFFLRADDDYFVCLERLTNELHSRPNENLIWGAFHCDFQDLIYIDESWVLLSSDVVERFLSQDPREILCHPHADQQIAVWIDIVYKQKDTVRHFDDLRLQIYPPARDDLSLLKLTNVCETLIGLHGSSPDLMKRFWRNRGILQSYVTPLTDISETCNISNEFNIDLMMPPYKFDLRPCVQNPRWTPSEGMWLGSMEGPQYKEV